MPEPGLKHGVCVTSLLMLPQKQMLKRKKKKHLRRYNTEYKNRHCKAVVPKWYEGDMKSEAHAQSATIIIVAIVMIIAAV